MPPPAPAGQSRAVRKVLLLTLLLNLAVSGGKILEPA